MTDEPVVNRRPGRPKGSKNKTSPVDREPVHEPIRAANKPEEQKYTYLDDDDDDRLKVPKELIPDGMDYQWVTDSVLGQPMPQRRARFERKGWTPVPSERHDGIFMPRGYKGEINVDGLVLMERPLEFSTRAKQKDRQRAAEQVWVRERQMMGGDLGSDKIAFDTQHKSALAANRVNKSYERVRVPNDE